MYYEDLTEYQYLSFLAKKDVPPGTLNIGWIDEKHEFVKKTPSPNLIDALKEITFTEKSLHLTRGYYFCPFCKNVDPKTGAQLPVRMEYKRKEMVLGSGIIIFGGKKHNYAFPDLLIHYVEVHGYHPPQEFIDDVLAR